jgi:hypothetical protein
MQFKSISRWALPVLIGLALLSFRFAPVATAETNDRLANLQINVWPEYDDTRVLVMYDGELADATNLPRDISLFIPSTASLSAEAYVDANGSFINIPDKPTTQDTGDGFTSVTVKLPAAKFHLEYYYNPLQGSPDKTMEFVYKAAQPAENVQLEIQQPLKADNFSTDPATQVKTTDAHSFTFYIFNYASLDVGQTQRIKISYTKTDPNPSIASIPQPASASASALADTQQALPFSSLLAPVLIAVALALMALGGFAWWSRGRNAMEPAPARTDNARRRQPRQGATGFCVQCGRGLEADDVFCPRCGTRRRNSQLATRDS